MSTILDAVPDKKETTIRLKLPTKRLLDEVAVGGETYDETIKRITGIVRNLSADSPQIVRHGKATGMKYERNQRTFFIHVGMNSYEVVCTFNDLRALTASMYKGLLYTASAWNVSEQPEWELELELLNIRQTTGHLTSGRPLEPSPWTAPQHFQDKDNLALIYFITLRKIFEEVLFIPLYDFTLKQDYFSLDKWREVYKKNNLSQESLYRDVEKKLQNFEQKGTR